MESLVHKATGQQVHGRRLIKLSTDETSALITIDSSLFPDKLRLLGQFSRTPCHRQRKCVFQR